MVEIKRTYICGCVDYRESNDDFRWSTHCIVHALQEEQGKREMMQRLRTAHANLTELRWKMEHPEA